MNGVGAVAQLGERSVRNAKVEGSNPFRSTFHFGMISLSIATHRISPWFVRGLYRFLRVVAIPRVRGLRRLGSPAQLDIKSAQAD